LVSRAQSFWNPETGDVVVHDAGVLTMLEHEMFSPRCVSRCQWFRAKVAERLAARQNGVGEALCREILACRGTIVVVILGKKGIWRLYGKFI
jgi:hypothetical protein